VNVFHFSRKTDNILQFESIAFRFATKVFPTVFSFVATLEKTSKLRILAKAPPKRSQTRNFVQSATPSSRSVYNRFVKNVSATENEIYGSRFIKPELQSLWSWQYVTGDTDGAWITLWEGVAASLVVQGEPMKHRATFCSDASSSWLETDTILIEVCGLKTLGTAFSDPGFQLAGVANAQLNGTRGGSLQGLVQSMNSQLVYMPDAAKTGEDSFDVSMKDLSNGLSSTSERVQVSIAKRPSFVVAADIEATVPFNHSVIVTLTGFAFSELLGSFFIETQPANLVLKQYDGLPIEFSVQSNSSLTTVSSQVLITDALNRIRIDIPNFSVGANYDSFEYSVGVMGSTNRGKANVTVHVWCRSATYYNTTLNRCLPCNAGTFNKKMSLSTSCTKCPPGTDSQPGSLTCVPCPIGKFAGQGALCLKCPPGTFSPTPGLQMCIDCPKGTFAQNYGASLCGSCGNLAYVDESRSVSCKNCPLMTISNSKHSESVFDCKCIEGSYETKGATGKECFVCPNGAYCHGDRYPPVTKRHFWTLHAEWNSAEMPQYFICDHRGVRNVCRGFPEFDRVELMARCAHRGVPGLCDDYPTIPTLLFGNASAFDDRRCSRGYVGRICSNCDLGYYNYPGGACVECPSAILVIAVAATVIFCFVLVAAASASPVIPIYISVSNFQNLVLLSRLGIPHPPAMAAIWGILAIFNVNFELIPFQCILGSAFDWAAVWYLEMFTLALVFAMCVGRWLVPYILYLPLLNKHANRSLKQHRPSSAIPVNQYGGYRPSRPSTPSSQASDKADLVQSKLNQPKTENMVVVDFVEGAPSIDADVFEDDSESAVLDAVNLGNVANTSIVVRTAPNIRGTAVKTQMTRTGLVSAHSAASSAASSIDLESWKGLSVDELDFYLDSAIWIGCFVLEHFFYFSSLVNFRVYACR